MRYMDLKCDIKSINIGGYKYSYEGFYEMFIYPTSVQILGQ